MTSSDVPMISFAHEGTLLSLRIPGDWESGEAGTTKLRFRPPSDPESERPGPWIDFERTVPEGHGQEWLADLCRRSITERQSHLAEFRVMKTDRYQLSSFAEVIATAAEWCTEADEERSGLTAFILASPYQAYRVEGEAPRALAGELIPAFEAIVRSTRILSSR